MLSNNIVLFNNISNKNGVHNDNSNFCQKYSRTRDIVHIGVNLGGGQHPPPPSLALKGVKHVWPSFLASNTHLATRNSKFQTEIEPECVKDLFCFGLHVNLGAKFLTEIK